MALFKFGRKDSPAPTTGSDDLVAFLNGFSIEVMPRTAEKVEDFSAILPQGTRVYIAHIEGTPIEDMVATAARLRREGFEPMPHFPARIIKDKAMLTDWVARYKGEADVRQGLILAGNPARQQFDGGDVARVRSLGLRGKMQPDIATGLGRHRQIGHAQGTHAVAVYLNAYRRARTGHAQHLHRQRWHRHQPHRRRQWNAAHDRVLAHRHQRLTTGG